MELIHHYTSIKTLELILKNRCIRFNRLDRVDDLSEHKALRKYKLDKYIFVSCWTEDAEESIPLWNMYSDGMKGVRISLQKEVFTYKELVAPKGWTKYGRIEPGTKSPINFITLIGDNYLIMPFITNKSNFYRKVNYVENIETYYQNILERVVDPVSNKLTLNIKMGDIAYFKNKEWLFQKESRFILIIFPAMKLPEDGFINKKVSDDYSNFMLNSIVNGKPAPFEYFDVRIEKDVLENMRVVMGPKTILTDHEKVKEMLNEYTIKPKPFLSKSYGSIAL